jgi:membrane protein implicated in regulation of membrane protease activity
MTPRDWPIAILIGAAFVTTWAFTIWLTIHAIRYTLDHPWPAVIAGFLILFLILAAVGDNHRQHTNARYRRQWKERG